MNISILDLSAYIGLVAVGAVTINLLLGMLMAFRYSPVRYWPHRRINYFQLHNWTGYIALLVTILHPVVLLLNKTTRFRVIDLVFPIHSPSQPLENTVGAIALYMIGIIVVTSYMRVRIGRRVWKAFHFTTYVAAVALFWHSIFTDPALKNSRVDWLDGGKLFVEICVAVILVISFSRWRYSRRNARQAR